MPVLVRYRKVMGKMTISLDKLTKPLAASHAKILASLVNLLVATTANSVYDLVFSGQDGIEGILSQFAAIKDTALNLRLNIRVLITVAEDLCHLLFVGVWE